MASVMVSAIAKHARRPTIFEGPRSPSLRLLQGLERTVPPSADSPILFPSPKTLKPLPPVPVIETADAEPMLPMVALRSSSLDARSPGAWEPPVTWDHNEQEMPSHPLQVGYYEPFSLSSPHLTMKELALPILEARTYAPLLPEPSPSLTASSRRSSGFHVVTHLSPVSPKKGDQLWIDLPPSPPSPEDDELQPITPTPQMLPPPRVLHPRAQNSTESLPSPISPTELLSARACSSSPPADRLKVPWSGGLAKAKEPPSQTPSRLKAPWSPGIAYPLDRSTSSARLKEPWSPQLAHTRDGSLDKALSKLGINEDGSENTQGRTYAKTHRKVTSKEGKPGEDVGPTNYHDALVEQYRALAAPTVGQWDDSSDDEQAVGNFRLVPKPLFWMQNDRESTVKLDEQRAHSSHGLLGGQQRRASLSHRALQVTLPAHSRSKSDESGKSPEQYKQAGILRSPKKLLNRSLRASVEKKHIGMDPPIRLPLRNPSNQQPLDVMVTGAEGSSGQQFPHVVIHSAKHRHLDTKEESSQFTDFAQLGRQRSRPTHIKTLSTETTTSVYSQASDRRKSSIKGSLWARPMKDNPLVASRESQRPAPAPLVTTPHGGGFRGMFKNARDSISPTTSPRSSLQRPSLDFSSKRDSRLSSNHSDEDKEGFRLPSFVEKAFEARREQAREKRREELKKKIKVVGEADPGIDIQYDPLNRRRETFGEGWV